MKGAEMEILIVEDDPLHRSFLREQVSAALPECITIYEAENGQQGETLARSHRAAHVVMDLQMNARNGIEAARTIWRERPDTRILFWSNYADEAYVRGVSRIVPNGAAYGYVLKSTSEERLKLALRSIFIENQCVIDNEVRSMQQRSFAQTSGFSESEYEILMDIALGMTDRVISERRHLSLRSVQNRLQQIYSKLDVHQSADGLRDDSPFNLRARAVTVAMLRKLLNYGALEKAEAELQQWMRGRSM
jgi:DNA-binding NarL/FixJ family response regulator